MGFLKYLANGATLVLVDRPHLDGAKVAKVFVVAGTQANDLDLIGA